MRTEIQSTNNQFPLFLLIGLLIGICLALSDLIPIAGFIIYGIASLGVLFYGLNISVQVLVKGLIISFSGLLSSIGVISAMLHWPYAIELRLIMVLPLLGFLYLLIKRKLTKLEIGLLLILNLDFGIKIGQIFNV